MKKIIGLLFLILPFQVFGDLKILIVEDVNSNQRVLKQLLLNYGKSHSAIDSDMITIVENGQQAFDELNQMNCQGSSHPYNLVFMDNEMPIKSGIETLKALKKLRDDKKATGSSLIMPHIVAISGTHNQEMVKSDLVSDAIQKPFNRTELFKLLDRILPMINKVPVQASLHNESLLPNCADEKDAAGVKKLEKLDSNLEKVVNQIKSH